VSLSSAPSTQNEQDSPEIAFPLPGGGELRYWYPNGKSYKTATLTWMGPGLTKRRAGKKGHSPCIAGWNDNIREQLVIADFDKLEKLPPTYPSFDALYAHLKNAYAGMGIAFRTYSGNVKLVFVIRLMDDLPMDLDTSFEFLRYRLGDELFDAADKKKSAQTNLGLTPEIVEELRRSLPVISVIPLYRCTVRGAEKTGYSCTPLKQNECNNDNELFSVYEGPMDTLKVEIKRFIGKSPTRKKLIRYLLHRRGLITEEGFDLPTPWISEQLKAKQDTVWESLKMATTEEFGLLKVIDHTYSYGRDGKGKTYVATGALAEEIQRLAPRQRKPEPFPPLIKDGAWEEELKRLAMSWYPYPDEFLNNVTRLTGWNLEGKERPQKAIRVLNRFRQWNGLPKHVLDSNDPVWGPFVKPRRLGPVHIHR
jgi:hypothetical protein